MKQLQQRGFVSLWLVIFILAAAMAAGGVMYVANRTEVLPPLDIPAHTVMPTVTPKTGPMSTSASPIFSPGAPSPVSTAVPIPSDARLNSYPSPDNRFTVDVYDVGTETNQCPFRIKDRGQDYFKRIACTSPPDLVPEQRTPKHQ
jgi:hypothetical protein